MSRFKLKNRLTHDIGRLYFVGEDVHAGNLEKLNRTGSQLITGRNVLDMALRGMKNYRKALVFCTHK